MNNTIVRFVFAWAFALIALSCSAASNQAVITIKVAADSPARTAFIRGDGWRTVAIYEATNSGNVSGVVSNINISTEGVTWVTALIGGSDMAQAPGIGKTGIWIGDHSIAPGQTVRIEFKADIDQDATNVRISLDGFSGKFNVGWTVGSSAVHAAVDSLPPSGPTNLSVRTKVSPDEPTIVGFHVEGEQGIYQPVLIRAVGPTLKQFGVANPLADPSIQIYDSSGKPIEGLSNDDWYNGIAWAFPATGAFPLSSGSKDSALVAWLPPGNYTVQIKGYGTGQGTALVEIYGMKIPYGKG